MKLSLSKLRKTLNESLVEFKDNKIVAEILKQDDLSYLELRAVELIQDARNLRKDTDTIVVDLSLPDEYLKIAIIILAAIRTHYDVKPTIPREK